MRAIGFYVVVGGFFFGMLMALAGSTKWQWIAAAIIALGLCLCIFG